jgi:hypothetical protein
MIYRFILFLGHGRALEAFLVILKAWYFFILFPGWPVKILVLSDLQWFVPDYFFALPFGITALLQGLGLYLNYVGSEKSWMLRAGGAMIAIMMWSWLLFKSILIGEVATSMFPVVATCLPASVFILWKAMNRLPVPGARGLL